MLEETGQLKIVGIKTQDGRVDGSYTNFLSEPIWNYI